MVVYFNGLGFLLFGRLFAQIGILEYGHYAKCYLKNVGNFLNAGVILASQIGLCSIELVFRLPQLLKACMQDFLYLLLCVQIV
jgi:hypothetical protein